MECPARIDLAVLHDLRRADRGAEVVQEVRLHGGRRDLLARLSEIPDDFVLLDLVDGLELPAAAKPNVAEWVFGPFPPDSGWK